VNTREAVYPDFPTKRGRIRYKRGAGHMMCGEKKKRRITRGGLTLGGKGNAIPFHIAWGTSSRGAAHQGTLAKGASSCKG